MSSGFRDKLYWRFSRHEIAHCFKKQQGGGYGSLCGRMWIPKSKGGETARPAAIYRCARCDVAEMRRRGWDESGPTLVIESDDWIYAD